MTIDRIFIGRAAQNGMEDGGPGSGNFGHKGRPGLVGGSGKGGGKAYRTESSESPSGYVGVQRAKEFKGIAEAARREKTVGEFVRSLTPAQRTQLENQRLSCGTQESLVAYAKRLHRLMNSKPLPPVQPKQKAPKPEKAPAPAPAPKPAPTPAAQPHKVAQGQNLEGKWRRNSDAFPYEINDIIHAQGFDGLPKVVSRAEFDAAVKASKFIAQRSYTGSNEAEADQFREQLYRGEWYVSCTNGGAQYGQGMYCAADYTGKLSDGIKEEMRHYREQWQNALGGGMSQYGYAQDAYNKTWADGIGQIMSVPGIHPGRFVVSFGLLKGFYNKPSDLLPAKKWIRENPEAAEKMKGQLKELIDRCVAARDEIANMTPEQFQAFQKKNSPTSYTETFTLTPDAKIVKYDDIIKEYQAYGKSYNHEKMVAQSTDDVLDSMGVKGEKARDYKVMLKLYNTPISARSDAQKAKAAAKYGKTWEEMENTISEVQKAIYKRYEHYRGAFVYDVGSYAAMRGYDAINAEGHGESDSYTVILNRTKCIFLDPNEEAA